MQYFSISYYNSCKVVSCTFKSHVKYLSCIHEVVKLALNFTIANESRIDALKPCAYRREIVIWIFQDNFIEIYFV